MIDQEFWSESPDTWDNRLFKYVTDTTSGKAFDSDKFIGENKSGYTPVVRIRDIHNIKTEAYTDEEFGNKYLVENGDLLVGMDGNFEAAFWEGEEAALNQRVLKIESKSDIKIDFLKHWLDIVLPHIHKKVPSATVKHLSVQKHLNPSVIPVPPLKKQEQIIDVIKDQLERIDRLKTSVDNISRFLEKYEESHILSLMTNSAEVPTQIPPVESSIPDDWKMGKVEDVVIEAKNGGTPKRSSNEYWGGEIDWLSSGEVVGIEIFEAEESITQIAINESSAKIFPENSVLVAMYGATRGQSTILREAMSGNQAICCLVPNQSVISEEYLLHYFKLIKEKLASEGRGGGQKNINQTTILEQDIPIPPLDEQRKIVNNIEKINFSKIEKSSELLKSLFDEYRNSVLSYAFQDELSVPNHEQTVLGKSS